MGGIGIGLSFIGFQVVAACDHNSLACRHLSANHRIPVVHGSVCDDQTLYSLQLCGGPEVATYTLGFPCQPFSRQGDGQGLSDRRVNALWSSLRAMYLHQAVAGLLECVPGVEHDLELQRALQSFASMMGWSLHSQVLDLACQWPCRRKRWWAILCDSQFSVSVNPWPVDSRFQTVDQIIPEWPIWSQIEEEDLRFTAEETEKFGDVRYSSDCRRLAQTSVCPTFLHSYGHGLRACSCGCRGRFTEDRLLTFGLRGFGIRSAKYSFERFLHCQEVAFLLTVPSLVQFRPGREELPLLGQIAAPLQAVWMGHALLQAFASSRKQPLFFTAVDALLRYKSMLFESRHDSWTWSTSLGENVVSMHYEGEPLVDRSFRRSGKLTGEQLIRAESIFTCWGDKLQVGDGPRCLSVDAVVQTSGRSGPYSISVTRKQQLAPKPDGVIVVRIILAHSTHLSFLHAGSFVFEALWDNDLCAV